MASLARTLLYQQCSKVPRFLSSGVGCKFYSSDVSSKMEDAKRRVQQLTESPGNEAMLKMYALYKQATVGPCNTKKPGMIDFVGQAKWKAWNGLGSISKDEAGQQYVELVDKLAGPVGETADVSATETPTSDTIEGLDISTENGICTVRLNRPKKLNAITTVMYDGIRDALNNTAQDDSVRLVYLTGTGNYFSSGNDLSNFTQIPPGGPKQMAADGRVRCQAFVDAFIKYPKPIICGVNGPAFGIMATILGLADLVYASDAATFQTPFSSLGQSPEGCSSYTFPKMMGNARANEVLLAGRKLTAQEAFDRGLLTDVIPSSEFQITVAEKVKHLSSLPPMSVQYSRALNRDRELETLLRVNAEECLRLEERWLSVECMNAITKFLAKK